MSKGMKVTLVIIVVLILIFAVLFFMYQQKKSDTLNENNTTIGNIIQDANTGLDNMLNDILNEENVENTTNTENNSNTSSSNNTQTNTPDTDNDVTPREKKAQELVKTEWKKLYGNTDGVSFNNVSIQADGKYLISVNDSKTTKVIAWYVVNVDTGVVNEK